MFPKKDSVAPDFEIFVLFDSKAAIYQRPIFGINRFDVVRELENLFTDPSQARNVIVTNSEDFQIFKIGDFSKKTAKINYHEPEHIVNVHEIKARLLPKNSPVGILPT